MSNSSLVNYTKISPNSTNPRKSTIKKITIHHMAGNLTVERCGELFANPSRQASANYGIGSDGRVGMYVEEKNRAWTSGNADNDNQAITIEVANDVIGGNWHVSDKALAKLIDLCTDICKRNGIKKLNFTGDKNGNLTMHKYFQATACPGEYLASKFSYITNEVNKRLEEKTTTVTYKAGETIKLSNTPLYSSASSKTASSKKTGTYYIWSEEIVNGKIRITNTKQRVGVSGQVTGFVNVSDITKSSTTSTTSPSITNVIKVGSTVKIKKGAKTYEGKSLASFVYSRKYKVKEIKGDRVVVTYLGITVAAIKKTDLVLV